MALAFLVGVRPHLPGGDRPVRRGPHLLRRLRQTTGLPPWLILPVIFVAVAGVMAMIAEGVGRQFVEFEPLEAYRLDIAGSILGIVAFSTFRSPGRRRSSGARSVAAPLHRPPAAARPVLQLVALAGLLLIARTGVVVDGVDLVPLLQGGDHPAPGRARTSREINVNGVPHQAMTIMSSGGPPRRSSRSTSCPTSARRQATLDDVLIVGAGTGTDVAVALAEGAGHVDAVEIDPRLQQIGAEQLTRTGPTTTRASASTSTTGGRSSSAPTRSTT